MSTSIVNFSIPKTLDRRVKDAVRKKGFPSRAELFRFAVIRYLDEGEKISLDDNSNITALSQELERELTSKISQRRLPSIKKQLDRVKDL